MAKKNPLDSEVSVGVKITPTEISGKSRSRFVSACDRLFGNLLDRFSPGLEDRTAIARAKTEANVKIIEALSDHAVAQFGENKEFAERAFSHLFGSVLEGQRNAEAVIAAAAEQLRLPPPSPVTDDGPEALDEGFLGRFEGHARTANTEDLRIKWAGVLAAEIRNPGTISNKVMRIIDEIPQETASLFNVFCKDCIGKVVPMHLSGDIGYERIKYLFRSELIDDATMLGPVLRFVENTDSNGNALWIVEFGDFAIAIKKDNFPRKTIEEDNFIIWDDSGPSIRVYALTESGQAVASIVNRDELNAARRFAEAFNKTYPLASAGVFKINSQGLYASI